MEMASDSLPWVKSDRTVEASGRPSLEKTSEFDFISRRKKNGIKMQQAPWEENLNPPLGVSERRLKYHRGDSEPPSDDLDVAFFLFVPAVDSDVAHSFAWPSSCEAGG